MPDFLQITKVTSLNALQLLKEGIISCVISQDWRVNRITPEFLNIEQFKKTIVTRKKLLHLGIGNGECCRFFDNIQYFIQSSISDKLYIDPIDIISLYLKKCNFSKEFFSLAEIMRNEFLIAISFEELYEENKESFSEKDKYIYKLLSNQIYTEDNYSYSYNVILLLLHILNTNPSLLLPYEGMQRYVTPLGRHIVSKKIAKPLWTSDSRFDATIAMEDIVQMVIEYFGKLDNIYLSEFMKVKFFNEPQFNYIFATRSDAFLKEKYAEFVLGIMKYLSKDGFYISDGIVGSYSYELYYNEFTIMQNEVGGDRIFLVKAEKKSQALPLQEISGIIIAGRDAVIDDVYSFIPRNRLISPKEILTDEFFMRQCIWSDIFSWASTRKIDLEKFRFKDINDIINKYVKMKQRNKYTYSLFNEEALFKKVVN